MGDAMCEYQEMPDHHAQSDQTRFTCKQEQTLQHQISNRKYMQMLTQLKWIVFAHWRRQCPSHSMWLINDYVTM